MNIYMFQNIIFLLAVRKNMYDCRNDQNMGRVVKLP